MLIVLFSFPVIITCYLSSPSSTLSIILQLFLGCLPEDQNQWLEACKQSREAYRLLKDKVILMSLVPNFIEPLYYITVTYALFILVDIQYM